MGLRLLLCALLVFLQFSTPTRANASTTTDLTATDGVYVSSASTPEVVRAVLFWMATCGHCHKVINEDLPPLQQKYGSKLDIIMVEVKDVATSDRLDRTAAALGFKSGDYGVPFMVIGDRALMGSVQIPLELPGLIDKYLAAGGVDVPKLPGLESITTVATSSANTGASATSAPAEVKSNGFALARVVLGILVLALLYAVVAIVRRRRGQTVPHGPAWLGNVLPILCLVGLAIALYLSYVETTATPAVCGPVGDCNAVQSSPYARLFGIVPVGVFGTLGYIAILAAWFWARLRRDALAGYAPLAIFVMTAFGMAFTIYLTYLELFVIKAICVWCLASAVIMSLLLVLSVGLALQRKQPPQVEKALPEAENWQRKKRR